jgi:hypothetical protein
LYLLYRYLPVAGLGIYHPQNAVAIFSFDGACIDTTRDMQRMMETAVTAFDADIAGTVFCLFAGALSLKHEGRPMLRQTDIFNAETGQIEFQDHLVAGFVHIHRRMVLALAKDITKLKGIQKITDIAELPAEEFLPERLPAGKVWHITTLRPYLV